MISGWKETSVNVKTIDIKNQPIELTGVRAYICPDSDVIAVMPLDVVRAEQSSRIERFGLQDRDIATLIMLYAQPAHFQKGYVHLLYRLNKMLFYQWIKLKEIEMDEALPHDKFEAIERGPRPIHLKEDLRRLERLNYIKISWPKGNEKRPIEINLTKAGHDISEFIWSYTPDFIREITVHWKKELFLLKPRSIMSKVHEEYPEWKTQYSMPDDE